MPRDDAPLNTVIGKNLRRLRSAAGLTQQQVGDRLGLSFQQVQKYERGDSPLSAPTLHRLARLLGCDHAAFFAGLMEDAAPRRDPSDRQQRVLRSLARAV